MLNPALPNITGSFQASRLNDGNQPVVSEGKGCFIDGNNEGSRRGPSNSYSNTTRLVMKFDASLSNPIYNNSDVVLPATLRFIPQIRY